MKNIEGPIKNKKFFFIIGGVCILIIALLIGISLSNNKSDNKDNNKDNVKDVDNKDSTVDKESEPTAPASDTEDLIASMEEITINKLENDRIEFSNETDIKEGEKVAVWIYSQPKFLGYFEVIVKNGIKQIEGLKEALEKISIEIGTHNIAISTEEGKPIGYINVYIEKDGQLNQSEPSSDIKDEEQQEQQEEQEVNIENKEEKTTTKQITVKEEIAFKTTKQNEANMKKGTTKVVQKGARGTKEIKYSVTYDSNGKEISRKKISEKTTKEPVEQIEKVGTSDFNIKTDKIKGTTFGMACPESQTYINEEDGLLYCDDINNPDLAQFGAKILDGKLIVTAVGGQKLKTAIIATSVNQFVSTGTYNGQKYYFDERMGSMDPEELTLDFCKEYNLQCGTW